MTLRRRLALAWAPDLHAVLRHVQIALDELGRPGTDTPAPIANAVLELEAARELLRGKP